MSNHSQDPRAGLTPNPHWYQHAVIYEIPVRAYCDSNRDGVGDLPGLVSKLDYLKNLGVDALWLLPFYPSPMRDGGYDIADYTSVHPMYGTLEDFTVLLREAHARGMRVITELVINHTSKEHPWFQRARRAPPGSPWRNFYVWSDTPSPTRTPASSSRTSRPRTGRGTPSRRPTTGTASTATSPTSTSTTRGA
jgi:maltose alpha-D-glucosyltransferase/alpha-amylase